MSVSARVHLARLLRLQKWGSSALGGLLIVSEDKVNSCGLIECFYYCFSRRKLLVSRKEPGMMFLLKHTFLLVRHSLGLLGLWKKVRRFPEMAFDSVSSPVQCQISDRSVCFWGLLLLNSTQLKIFLKCKTWTQQWPGFFLAETELTLSFEGKRFAVMGCVWWARNYWAPSGKQWQTQVKQGKVHLLPKVRFEVLPHLKQRSRCIRSKVR